MSIEWSKEHYHLRDGKVRWRAYEIQGADLNTFEPLNHIWARDVKQVYTQHRVNKLADRATFEVLNYIFAKDRNRVFYLAGWIKEADAKTFRTLDEGRQPIPEWARFCRVEWNYTGFARDARNAYWDDMMVGKACVLRGADLDSFQVLEHSFAKDKQYVWHARWRLKKAAPETFRILNPSYSTDGRFVYYGEILIPGADPASFVALRDFWARDKGRAYFQRDPIPIADAATFECIDHHFARDKERLFSYMGHIVTGINPSEFEPIGNDGYGRYYRDARRIYWGPQADRVRGVHFSTFEVVNEDRADARDQDWFYRCGERVKPRDK